MKNIIFLFLAGVFFIGLSAGANAQPVTTFPAGGFCSNPSNDGAPCSDKGDGDGCYPYGNGCEERVYTCQGGACVYKVNNRHTDGDYGKPFCKENEVYIKHRDYYCFGQSCTYKESDVIAQSCDDGDFSTYDFCKEGTCVSEDIKNPYDFTPAVGSACMGSSFPIHFKKKDYFVPNTMFDFYLGSYLVRSNCPSSTGDALWDGACGIENINIPAGVYELKAVYTINPFGGWKKSKTYTTIIKNNFEVTSKCSASVQCAHGESMMTNTVAFNPVWDGNRTADSGYYVICKNTGLRIKDISSYNAICSNGVEGNMIAPLVAWVYNENGSRLTIADNGLNAQYCHLPDVDRSSIIGNKATTDGTLLESDSGAACGRPWGEVQHKYINVYWFVNPGKYDVFVDMIHAWCDSPSNYLCPWLGGTWRSTLCRMGLFDTPAESEGWIPLEKYKVFVPKANITIKQSEDIFDPPQKTVLLSWTINNTGTARLRVNLEKSCEDWDCTILDYNGETWIMKPGDTHTVFMNVTTERTSIYTKNIGISVTYVNDYGLACMPENTVDSLVKITIPHMF